MESANAISSAFSPLFDAAERWRIQAQAIQVTDAGQTREMKLARECRLGFRELRINADKVRKRLKEESLRRGRAIDGAYNLLEFLIVPIETHLKEQEQFIERLEAQRKANLAAARAELLRPYCADTTIYPLGDMAEPMFDQLLQGFKLAAEHKAAEEKKRKDEEAARIAAQAEEERRIREENERFRAEAAKAEADRLAREEQARAELEAERQRARQAAEQLRQEHAAQLAKEAAERDKERRAAQEQAENLARETAQREQERIAREAKLAAEKAAAEEVARKAKRKIDEFEAKRKRAEAAEKRRLEKLAAEEKAAAEKAAAAPDKEKLMVYLSALKAVPIPTMATEAGYVAADEIKGQLEQFDLWAEFRIEAL